MGLLVTKSPHFYWLEMSLFCPRLLSGEAEHSWLPTWGPCRARLSWIPQAGEKVHPFFLGCERHQAKPVSDRSQRQAFDSDLGQRVRSGSGQILAGELLLAPPLTNHHLHWAALVSSLSLGRWGGKENHWVHPDVHFHTQQDNFIRLTSFTGQLKNIL